MAERFEKKDIVELLLKNKANINAVDNYGETPLHDAAINGRLDMVKLLLTHQAAVNATNKDGETPLRETAKYGHKEVVDLLRQHGGHE